MPVDRIPKPSHGFVSEAELERQYLGGEGWQTVPATGGGGGGSQDLAQVLAEGGDPDGNPITGPLLISIAVDDDYPLRIVGAEGSDYSLISAYDHESAFGFEVGPTGIYSAVETGAEYNPAAHYALAVDLGEDYNRVLTIDSFLGTMILQPAALGGTTPFDYTYGLNLKPPATLAPQGPYSVWNALAATDDDLFNDEFFGKHLVDLHVFVGAGYTRPSLYLTRRRTSDGKLISDGGLLDTGWYGETVDPDDGDAGLTYIGADAIYGYYAYGPGASTIDIRADFDGTQPIFQLDPSGVTTLTIQDDDDTLTPLLLNGSTGFGAKGTIGAEGSMNLIAGCGGGTGGARTVTLSDFDAWSDSGDGIYWEGGAGADRSASFYVGGQYKIYADTTGIGFFASGSHVQFARPTTLNDVIDLLVGYGLAAA